MGSPLNPAEELLSNLAENFNLDERTSELKEAVMATKFPGFTVVRTDQEFLRKFIRTKNGNVQAALESMKKYYACVHRNSNFVQGVKPQDFTDALNSGAISVLRNSPDNKKSKVIIFHMGNWKPQEITLRNIQLSLMILSEHFSFDPVCQKHGVTYIIDLQGGKFHHVWRLTPRELYRCFDAILVGFPLKVPAVHFLCPPAVFKPVLQFILSLGIIKEKIKNRFHFHSKLESLHTHLSKDKLPVSWAGNLDSNLAFNRDIIDHVLESNVPYEDYWNGEKYSIMETSD